MTHTDCQQTNSSSSTISLLLLFVFIIDCEKEWSVTARDARWSVNAKVDRNNFSFDTSTEEPQTVCHAKEEEANDREREAIKFVVCVNTEHVDEFSQFRICQLFDTLHNSLRLTAKFESNRPSDRLIIFCRIHSSCRSVIVRSRATDSKNCVFKIKLR